jgi:hypothetical protein
MSLTSFLKLYTLYTFTKCIGGRISHDGILFRMLLSCSRVVKDMKTAWSDEVFIISGQWQRSENVRRARKGDCSSGEGARLFQRCDGEKCKGEGARLFQVCDGVKGRGSKNVPKV